MDAFSRVIFFGGPEIVTSYSSTSICSGAAVHA
jgi:hypothetical protein